MKFNSKLSIPSYIRRVKPYIPGKPIEEVKRELGLRVVYKLASNENPFGPTPLISKNIKKIIKNINRYPEASCFYLRRKIADRLNVKNNQLIFGNGSDELVVLTLRTFLERGEEVVVCYPSFLIYEIQSQASGAKLRRVPLKNFRYNLKGMLEKITPKTRLIFIANPDNPTGTYLSSWELREFLERVPSGILVFIDEAYYEYARVFKDYPRSLDLLKKYKNLIIARTFSKAWGLAGLRIGYAIATPQIISFLERVKEPFNVNILAQRCALMALKDEKYMQWVVEITLREKEILYQELEKLKLNYIKTATNFVPIHIPSDVNFLYQELLKRGIVVRNLDGWGLKGFIRVTLGKPLENRIFIKTLRRLL